jgi:hypothetical protein
MQMEQDGRVDTMLDELNAEDGLQARQQDAIVPIWPSMALYDLSCCWHDPLQCDILGELNAVDGLQISFKDIQLEKGKDGRPFRLGSAST